MALNMMDLARRLQAFARVAFFAALLYAERVGLCQGGKVT